MKEGNRRPNQKDMNPTQRAEKADVLPKSVRKQMALLGVRSLSEAGSLVAR